MRKLVETIIEDGITKLENYKTRTTVRGIIVNDERVLMVYSPQFNDYTFPGGGKKEDETFETALLRELKEELGADQVFDIKPYGKIVEYRYGLNQNGQHYEQSSYYYTCQVGQLGIQNLAEREKMHGVIPVWVNIKEAFLHNESIKGDHNHKEKGLKTVIERENAVLASLMTDFMRYFEVVSEYKNNQINLPRRATVKSAGYDLEAASDVVINPGEIKLVPTGLKVHLLDDEVLFVYPRSSLAIKSGLMMPNSVGVIDADYYNNPNNEGHIMVPLYHLKNEAVTIKKGQRIAQGIFSKYLKAKDDTITSARLGGFGSSDI